MLEVRNTMVKDIKRRDVEVTYSPDKSFKKTWEPLYTKGKAVKVY